jgi:amidophosphoribosyltransferase
LLGKNLTQSVLKSVNYDLENTVFSYIPNTAELAFGGLVEGVHEHLNKQKANLILENKNMDESAVRKILSLHPRISKVVLKDAKQRTFITDDENRDNLVNLVYDVTYGTIKKGVDNLVVMDDSIVRGTTLKKSILSILDSLGPKKIVVVSSAPQIRYPDCYGIDMAVLGKFIAFEAVVALLKDSGKENFLEEMYEKTLVEYEKPKEEQRNMVQEIYSHFTAEQISKKIAELLKPADLKADLEIIYQSLEGLHNSCPNHRGDWYFSGNYPTPGGTRVSNKAFINYMEGKNVRAY